ncbi:MAG: 3-hydroxyacyl-CoA dehydrogenase [Alphaproteobacteria bacterium]
MYDIDAPDLKLGVIGAGAMGSGIAHLAAVSGIEVRILDTREGAAATSCDGIAKRLQKRADDGKMDPDEAEASIARLKPANAMSDFAPCNIVIEAIVEDLDIKAAVFQELEGIVSDDAILASNTSSLPIGAIAARVKGRARIAGMHFFNPAPVMKLVELIRGPDTAEPVMDALLALANRMTRTPVVVKDSPGFLVNFGGRAYTTEALAIRHEQVADPAEIDAVMKDGFGFRMGPFELMDLTGIDVNFPVTRFVHESSFGDPRLRSTPEHRYLLETGQLGRKTKRGFYDYGEGAETPTPDTAAEASPATAVFQHGDDPILAGLISESGAELLTQDDGISPILASPLGIDATAYATQFGLDHRRLVCVDTVPDVSTRVTLMTAPGADDAARGAVIALFAAMRRVTAIQDSPGFIAQRIAAMVANLGCEMAQTGLATPTDIDLAMRLGLNYPKGPLELADSIGPARVHTILTGLQHLTGDDRYRPSQWLRRRGALGLSALQPA